VKFVQEERHFQETFWLDLHSTGECLRHQQKYKNICIQVETGQVHKLRDPDRDTGINFLNRYLHGVHDREIYPTPYSYPILLDF
jgi:hypothetical protein